MQPSVTDAARADADMAAAQRWLVLAVVLMGTFMAILDVAIVNVAIPAIRTDLHAGFGAVELVVSAYTLTYACLLITGGRLGDIHGRKPLFIGGMLLFAAASAVCGFSPNAAVLIGARAVQGIGGALMYPQVLAIIQVTFTGEDRARALGIFGSVIGLAAISGQIIGGALIAADLWGLQWRPIFLVNVPLALATALAAWFVLPGGRAQDDKGLDWGGVALITPALLLLIVPLLEGREAGWPAWMIACLVAAIPAFGVFVWHERRFERRGGAPLMPMRLFAYRNIGFGVPIAGLFTASYAGFLLILAIYLQIGLGFSAIESALIYTPSALGFFVTSLAAPKFVPVLGRHVLSLGYVVAAIGYAGVAVVAFAAGPRVSGLELAPLLLIAGVGQGLGLTPLIGTVISGLAPQEAGAGAGIVTTTLQVGNALGVALIGLLFFALLGAGQPGVAYAHAFAAALPASAILLLLAAFLVVRLPRTQYEVGNALLDRLPGWSTGFAYSMFLMTGGRAGDALFYEVLGRVTERRLARVQAAPQAPGAFLAFHFHEAAGDTPWLRYMMREALLYGNRSVPHEADRLPVIRAQVEETRQRQEAGLLPADMDPALLRLMGFALVSYPRLLPQITRMTTGMASDDPRFAAAWEAHLRRLGGLLQQAAQAEAAAGRP